MPTSRKPVTRKRKTVQKSRFSSFRFSMLLIPGGVALVLVIASFGFAAAKEENNAFCASCHTQPETTYYQRFQQNSQVDLATFHYTKNVKCIDCHSGEGVMGRVSAIMEGSRNAFAYYTHTDVQPSKMYQQMADANCVKCHAAVYNETDFNHHFHAFLTRWQAVDPNAAHCTSCHTSHTTDGNAQIAFLSQVQTEEVCQSCHAALGGGG